MTWRLAVCSILLFGNVCMAQAGNGEPPTMFVARTDVPIRIDGALDEEAWFRGRPATGFWENFPTDTTMAPVQTEVYMVFDDHYLYIGARCYSIGKDYVISSLRRDFRAGGNDNITFVLDPFNDRTNAFVFGMNPYGVTREALIANGGRSREDFDESWDNKWTGVSRISDGYWSCELAIPFSTLRFKEDSREWKFNCYRFDTQSNTRSTWHQIPQNQIIMSLAYMGNMVWEEPPQKTGASVAIIPFITGGASRDFENGEPAGSQFSMGGDAKIGITPSLNLDLTVNPDFSQVEVDRQVLNLDRFEIFFPERRQFFLENADLFGSFGDPRINPFFSRRIGSARVEDPEDPDETISIQNPIHYGARLSGKLDNNWRLGLLNMSTAREREYDLPAYNYTVAALQRKVFSRSNIGMIFVNKEAITETERTDLYHRHNRVMGLDYNLASSDNRWTGKVFFHKAFTMADEKEKFAHGMRLEHLQRRFRLQWNHQYVGEGFDAQVGFVRRKNYFSIAPEAQLYFYPSFGKINRHGPGADMLVLFTPGFGRSDHNVRLYWDADFRNTASLRASLSNEYTYLFEDFDPSRTDAESLPAETDYQYSSLNINYRSDQRKAFSWNGEFTVGQFFNGNRYQVEGSLNYRFQPYGFVEFIVNFTHLDLPTVRTDLLVVGPRIDVTFSRSLFLTTFVQYNNQIDNLNVNARLQWRFAPVSDFFLVYTDNYMADGFIIKNRSLVAKLTYWFNM